MEKSRKDDIRQTGRGSAIDTAKAIALGIPYDGDCWDFFSGKANPEKLAQLARRVFDVDGYDYDSTEAAYILVDEFEAFFKSMKLRTRLSEFDIDDTHFEEMALRATKGDTIKVGHYTELDAKECIEVLKLAR